MPTFEIERKWILVKKPGPEYEEFRLPKRSSYSEAVYITSNPYIRLRRKILRNEDHSSDKYRTNTITYKFGKGLVRQEYETKVSDEFFNGLLPCVLSGIKNQTPIHKDAEVYMINNHEVYVAEVDRGTPTNFIYAEVEFDSEEEACAYEFPFTDCGPSEVTGDDFWSMNNYWARTRIGR